MHPDASPAGARTTVRRKREATWDGWGPCVHRHACACPTHVSRHAARALDKGAAPRSHRGMLEGSLPATLGAYRIVRVLGHGGMGVVYHAEHGVTGEAVALKTVAGATAS